MESGACSDPFNSKTSRRLPCARSVDASYSTTAAAVSNEPEMSTIINSKVFNPRVVLVVRTSCACKSLAAFRLGYLYKDGARRSAVDEPPSSFADVTDAQYTAV